MKLLLLSRTENGESTSALSLFLVYYKVGEVFSSNPYPYAINGSLWSLSYEFFMYIIVGCLFFIRKNKILPYITVLAFFIFYSLYNFLPIFLHSMFLFIKLDTLNLYRLGAFFMAGACFNYVNFTILNKKCIQILLFIILTLLIVTENYNAFAPFVFTAFLIPFANSFSKHIQIPKSIGDISYGVYIYGFLVQQTLMHFFDFNIYLLFVTALIITCVFSYFSWHYIEKPILKFKNLIK